MKRGVSFLRFSQNTNITFYLHSPYSACLPDNGLISERSVLLVYNFSGHSTRRDSDRP